MTAPIMMAVFDFVEDLPAAVWVPFIKPVIRFGFPPYLVIRVQIAQISILSYVNMSTTKHHKHNIPMHKDSCIHGN